MKKLLLLLLLLTSISMSSKASHYYGNDLRLNQIGANQFVLILRLATSTAHTPQVGCAVYSEVANALITNVSLQLDSSRNDTTVFGGNTFTLSIAYYSDTVTLANNPNGYYAVAGHCCRGMSMNHVSSNMLYTCNIPDPAIVGGNSNPKFVDYPDSLFMLVNTPRFLDFSATDPDGDSLVYSLITPYDNTTGGTKPFSLLAFNAGYNNPNILGPGAAISINSSTGFLTTRPAQLGSYFVAVKCEEYRNGVKIGEVVRDILIPSVNSSIFTSLDEKNNEISATIFPNPSQGSFSILLTEKEISNSKLEIIDITGKQIMTNIINSKRTTVVTTDWGKGVYVIRITKGDSQTMKKVIIQ